MGATAMAMYTHRDVEQSPEDAWSEAMGSFYTATASTITIDNFDNDVFLSTLTKAFGSFLIVQGQVIGGSITKLERVDANDGTIYESITGLTLDATTFLSAAPEDRLAVAFAGVDLLTGYS